MTHGRKVNPNLMGPACLGRDFEQRQPIKPLCNLPLGEGGPALSCPGRHPLSLGRMPSNGKVNRSFILVERPLSNGKVGLVNGPILELPDELLIGLIVFRNHHHSGGLFVQTVDDPRPEHPIDSAKIPAVMDQGIDQRARGIAWGRVNDEAWRFVNDDDRRILVENGQGKGLWFQGERRRARDGSGNLISCLYVKTRLNRSPVEKDQPILNQVFGLGAGEMEAGPRKELVQALPLVLP